ncbi:hypothetical protein TRAPUB_4512 [Trametes pubescens]|uniref:Uncharacterized protein n=1 Tax=Trametes pubescens TaxID=154538 RepID=A0A1M2VAT4_TRAPU|nr:hypothetical protein TRAPUB_4512 [Trametes pubescens]
MPDPRARKLATNLRIYGDLLQPDTGAYVVTHLNCRHDVVALHCRHAIVFVAGNNAPHTGTRGRMDVRGHAQDLFGVRSGWADQGWKIPTSYALPAWLYRSLVVPGGRSYGLWRAVRLNSTVVHCVKESLMRKAEEGAVTRISQADFPSDHLCT